MKSNPNRPPERIRQENDMPNSPTLSLTKDTAAKMDRVAKHMTEKNGGIPISRGALGESILRPEIERRLAELESEAPKRGKAK